MHSKRKRPLRGGRIDPRRYYKVFFSSQNRKKCLEYFETKEYANIFCEVFERVSGINFFYFLIIEVFFL